MNDCCQQQQLHLETKSAHVLRCEPLYTPCLRPEPPCPNQGFQSGFGPLSARLKTQAEGKRKSGQPQKLHLLAAQGAPAPPGLTRLREPFYPPLGRASRAFGLPQAAAKRIFVGRSPHPLSADRQLRLIPTPQSLRRRKQYKGRTGFL